MRIGITTTRVAEQWRSYIHAVIATEVQHGSMCAKDSRIVQLEGQVAQLTFQLEALKRLICGTKSERFVPTVPGQIPPFELTANAQAPRQAITYTRTTLGRLRVRSRCAR